MNPLQFNKMTFKMAQETSHTSTLPPAQPLQHYFVNRKVFLKQNTDFIDFNTQQEQEQKQNLQKTTWIAEIRVNGRLVFHSTSSWLLCRFVYAFVRLLRRPMRSSSQFELKFVRKSEVEVVVKGTNFGNIIFRQHMAHDGGFFHN